MKAQKISEMAKKSQRQENMKLVSLIETCVEDLHDLNEAHRKEGDKFRIPMKEDVDGKGEYTVCYQTNKKDAPKDGAGYIVDTQALQLAQLCGEPMNQDMEVDGVLSPHNSSLNMGNGAPIPKRTLVVSLLGIVEILSPTSELTSLDFLNSDAEWMVLKRMPRVGNRADVGSTMRVGRPLIR